MNGQSCSGGRGSVSSGCWGFGAHSGSGGSPCPAPAHPGADKGQHNALIQGQGLALLHLDAFLVQTLHGVPRWETGCGVSADCRGRALGLPRRGGGPAGKTRHQVGPHRGWEKACGDGQHTVPHFPGMPRPPTAGAWPPAAAAGALTSCPCQPSGSRRPRRSRRAQ